MAHKKKKIASVASTLIVFGMYLLFALFQNPQKLLFISTSPIPTPQVKSPMAQVQGASTSAQIDSSLYEVTKVVDGDTLKVQKDGKGETVRLIGVDTPETVDPRKPVQCFGKEASNQSKKLLEETSVRLLPDPTQGEKDKYKRLLRYVILNDGSDLGEKLISEGFAHEYTYDLPYQNQVKYKLAQKIAQQNKRGLWADDACLTTSPSPGALP